MLIIIGLTIASQFFLTGAVLIQRSRIKDLERRQDRQDALLISSPVAEDGRLLGSYTAPQKPTLRATRSATKR